MITASKRVHEESHREGVKIPRMDVSLFSVCIIVSSVLLLSFVFIRTKQTKFVKWFV